MSDCDDTSPTPPSDIRELDKKLLLTASENANNENREIEQTRQNSNNSTSIEEEVSATTPDTPADDANSSAPPDSSETAATFKEYAAFVTYESGVAIYTDPESKHRYRWDKEGNKWTPESSSLENEHYRWEAAKNEWVLKEQQQQQQTIENEHYRWCHESQKWIPKAGAEGATVRYENGERLYTDKEGMTFFWDTEKSAWFPKITDDFMAVYQMNYGFVDNTTKAEKQPLSTAAKAKQDIPPAEVEAKAASTEEADKKGKRKAPQEPPKWFDLNPEHNTKVYVSNLPLDMTEEEFVELMSKCGMVTRDIRTQKLKVKLYLEPDGSVKGDGLCDYIKMESVELALNIIDGMDVRGRKISVTRAKFQMRGDYDPKLKPRKKQKKEKERERKMKEKLFDWRPDKMRGERGRHERIVIIKNLFAPETFEKHVERLLQYQQNLREECGKCGSVRRVVVYDRHADGVAQVTMADPEEADIVVQLMNRRQFGDRTLTAETWDGKTRYRTEETAEDAEKRISQWNEHLAKLGEEALDESDEEVEVERKTVDGVGHEEKEL